jgi:hypothetical protein
MSAIGFWGFRAIGFGISAMGFRGWGFGGAIGFGIRAIGFVGMGFGGAIGFEGGECDRFYIEVRSV